MTTLMITLSDDRLAKLREIADRFNITPEDLQVASGEMNREEFTISLRDHVAAKS